MQSESGVDASTLLPIRAGEVHYARIPVEYWEHRILMIKALGLNALSVYIIWNFHQVAKGVFDFKTGNKNLPLFLQLAQKHSMMVLFRPGPYVCAEWDFGGMPARLLNTPDIELRANNKVFLGETKIYFEALAPIIRDHMRTASNNNGCIVMLQIENEYGFYGNDKSYMEQLRKIWKDLDIHLTEYYVDWIENIKKCHWEGANIGINNFSNSSQEKTVREFEKKGFVLGGEIYSGWMTHWTEKWGGKSTKKVLADYQFLLANQHSFAMYMVHGGTNFGLSAGANGLKEKVSDYWGAITSYDYDAPINQQGSPTPKYHSVRQLLKKYTVDEFIEIPAAIPLIEIAEIKVEARGNLFGNLPHESITSQHPLVFQSDGLEMYHQGLVLYSTQVPPGVDFELKIVVHDFGLVYLGGHLVGVLDRTKSKAHTLYISKSESKQKGSQLQIVVQASGHINFDKNMLTDHKGLYSIEGLPKDTKWTMWKFPLDCQAIGKWKTNAGEEKQKQQAYPTVYEGSFILEEVGDTYLDVSAYGKGCIWVNGHNLGRYWKVGPQKRLFCPGVWMKKGQNQILVFNVHGSAGSNIQGVRSLHDSPIEYSDDQQQ